MRLSPARRWSAPWDCTAFRACRDRDTFPPIPKRRYADGLRNRISSEAAFPARSCRRSDCSSASLWPLCRDRGNSGRASRRWSFSRTSPAANRNRRSAACRHAASRRPCADSVRDTLIWLLSLLGVLESWRTLYVQLDISPKLRNSQQRKQHSLCLSIKTPFLTRKRLCLISLCRSRAVGLCLSAA